ncbi:unnamed protein product [Alternaria alternata]
MRVYESVFQTLDDTVDHPETVIANSDNDIELTLPSSLRNPDRRTQLSSWNNPDSLLIEHNVIAPFCQRPTQLNVNVLIEFPFLDNFTKATGFVSSFGCGTKQQRLSITLDPIRANPTEDTSPRKEKMINAATHWVEIARNMLVQGSEDTADSSVSLYVTHKIVDQVRETAIKQHYRGSAGIHWSPSIEALCYEFFNPKNLDKCLALFWSCWYPNWPTIHAPTFKMVEKSASLVAVMALVGACLSAEDRDHASAQLWFDLVEDLVYSDVAFDDQDISNTWKESTDTDRRSAHLQTLQAAYCVCLYQTWEGTRDIGLDQASLRSIDTSDSAGFDWEEYALRESLIRICSYICNIDASYALFFRHVPRTTLSELVMEMSSPESCFQASSKEECFIELKVWRKRMGIDATNMNVLSAVIALCDNAIMRTPAMRHTFAHLSVLNMFTIVHALYLQVYSLANSSMTAPDTTRMTSVENALRNWQQSWPSHTRDMELVDLLGKDSDLSTMWQRIGFMRYAPEYWLIAYSTVKKMYKQNDGISRISETAITVGNHDMIEARRLIAELRSGAIVPIVDS